MNHRSDIDGLRGLAVVLVLLYHARFGFLPGGYVGVDIFLVVSGFLITGLLVRQMDGGDFRFVTFFSRRMRRLMPAAVVMVAATLAAALFVMGPRDLRIFAGSCMAVLSLNANFYFWGRQGYFADQVPEQPLLHSWSLGLEEQFYLVFPAALAVVARAQPKLRLAVLVGAAICLFLVCVWATGRHPGAAFYLLPTRAWEFLLGGVVALLPMPVVTTGWFRSMAGALGLAGIAAAALGFSKLTPYPGVAALVPAAAAALLLWANATQTTPVARLLQWRALTAAGLISYSLYLWHWPVFALARYYLARELTATETWSALTAVLLLALLSWLHVEQRFRLYSGVSTLPRSSVPVGALALAVFAVAAFTWWADGLPQRVSPRALALDPLLAVDGSGAPGCHHGAPERVQVGDICVLAAAAPGAGGVLLWGDSHANAIAPAMARLGSERGFNVWQASYSSCPPLLGSRLGRLPPSYHCVEFNDTVLQAVQALGAKRVVLAAYWTIYLPTDAETAFARAFDPYSGAQDLGAGDARTNQANFVQGLQRTVQALGRLGVDVWIVRQVPIQRQFVPLLLARAATRGEDLASIGISATEHRQGQARVEAAFAALGRSVHTVDIAAAFCANERCVASAAGHPLYVDSHHLSTLGAELAMPRLRSIFE